MPFPKIGVIYISCSLKSCIYLSIMELEHLIFPHGHKVAPIPPPKMLLKLLDGPDREVRLGDVHDVVPVPARLQELPHPLEQQEQDTVAAPE